MRAFFLVGLILILVICAPAATAVTGVATHPGPSQTPAPTSLPPSVMPGATAEAQATAPALAPGVRGVFGSPITFATHDELASFGFNAGPSDGQFGAIPAGGGNYVFYGFAASSATCAGTPKVAGAYAFTGTLEHVTGSNGCTRVFGRGDGPQGWIFDKDYAGGGHIRFTDSVGVVAVAGGKADLTNSRTGLLISRVSSVEQSTIGVLFAPRLPWARM